VFCSLLRPITLHSPQRTYGLTACVCRSSIEAWVRRLICVNCWRCKLCKRALHSEQLYEQAPCSTHTGECKRLRMYQDELVLAETIVLLSIGLS
jgi:hypothetical protein